MFFAMNRPILFCWLNISKPAETEAKNVRKLEQMKRLVIPGTGFPGAGSKELRYDLERHALRLGNLQVDKHPRDDASDGEDREHAREADGREQDREGVGHGHVPDPVGESADCYAEATDLCREDLGTEDVRDYPKAHLEAAQVDQDARCRDYRVEGRACAEDAAYDQHQESRDQDRDRRQ